MPFDLHPYAAVLDGYVTRFITDPLDLVEGEVALPVVADPDPALGANERLWGPDYEVMADKVRAYGRAVPMSEEEIAAREAAKPRLSFAQMLSGLVTLGWITEADGELWLSGTLPQVVLDVIATLPQEARFPAKAKAVRPSEVVRDDPLVSMLGQAQGKTEADIDAFFAFAAQF